MRSQEKAMTFFNEALKQDETHDKVWRERGWDQGWDQSHLIGVWLTPPPRMVHQKWLKVPGPALEPFFA